MVKSGICDIQRQALVSLDMLSYQAQNAKDMLESDEIVDCMCRAVSELTDTESLSRSLSIVVNVFSAASAQHMTSKQEDHAVAIIKPVLEILAQETSIKCLHLHQQAVRVLVSLSWASSKSKAILSAELQFGLLQSKVEQVGCLPHCNRSFDTLSSMQKSVQQNLSVLA